MKEWSVDIEALSKIPLDEDFADAVLDALARHAPALSLGANRLDVRFNVKGRTEREAFLNALEIFGKALPQADPVRVEVETIDELDRHLASSNVPDLLGVAELAEFLKVSRQRASELAHTRGFPKPMVILKAGPVWRRSTVVRYANGWERQPGRPRAAAGATP